MSIINIALSGALAAQASVTASSQNTANLGTKGYTRQGVLLNAISGNGGRLSPGAGVEVSSLLRFSDSYKSQQLWRAASELGAHTQTQPYMTQLERVMGDDASSISNGVDNFFKALNAAGVDPTSTPLRQQIITTADSMSQSFNSIGNIMNNQLLSVHQQRDAIIPQANTALANIASLNGKIASAGSTGSSVSLLIDARDQAIDDLASQMSLEVIDQADGTRSVSLKTGQPLVIGNLAGTLNTALDASGSQVLTLGFTTSTFTIDNVTVGGQLGGLGDYERGTLLPLKASVHALAAELATRVNSALAGGKTMGTPPVAGGPLFVVDPAGSTNMLAVTPGYTTADLALSTTGAPGDSTNLQNLIAIKNAQVSTVPLLGPTQIGDVDTQLVGQLAVYSQKNKAMLATSTTVRAQAVSDWQSTSGVNRDEEAANLLSFQQMFQANMKVISVANDMFDATLAMMR